MDAKIKLLTDELIRIVMEHEELKEEVMEATNQIRKAVYERRDGL